MRTIVTILLMMFLAQTTKAQEFIFETTAGEIRSSGRAGASKHPGGGQCQRPDSVGPALYHPVESGHYLSCLERNPEGAILPGSLGYQSM